MRFLVAAAGLALLGPALARAQIHDVAGTVVDEQQSPLQGVTVRISGSNITMTTGPSGTFIFQVPPGGVVLTFVAVGREPRSLALDISRDTVLTVVMRARPVMLDTMRVRPGRIRIRGTVADSATNESIVAAQAGLFPDARYVSAYSGRFTFDKVNPGPVMVVVEAPEYLPTMVEFEASRDTTLRIRMRIDSTALRIIAVQVARLEARTRSIPFALRSAGREDIARQRASTAGELIDRLMYRSYDPARRAATSADDACVFYDDMRYAMSLMGKAELPKVTYTSNGLRPMCG
jgi:hypothetical protein